MWTVHPAARAVFVVVLSSAFVAAGCAESSFELAPDSRLPKWFKLPSGTSRQEVKVTMDYYALPWGRRATFKLLDAQGRTLSEMNGKQQGRAPLELKSPPPGYPRGYPSYEIITVNGVVDVIEHRQMEPKFYVTDDPLVRKEFGLLQ